MMGFLRIKEQFKEDFLKKIRDFFFKIKSFFIHKENKANDKFDKSTDENHDFSMQDNCEYNTIYPNLLQNLGTPPPSYESIRFTSPSAPFIYEHNNPVSGQQYSEHLRHTKQQYDSDNYFTLPEFFNGISKKSTNLDDKCFNANNTKDIVTGITILIGLVCIIQLFISSIKTIVCLFCVGVTLIALSHYDKINTKLNELKIENKEDEKQLLV
jgi:hypothetical protein